MYTIVIEGMLSAKPPSYAKVLEYDRQIRQTTLPNVRLYLRPDEANYSNPSVVLRSFFLSHFRSISASRFHISQVAVSEPRLMHDPSMA